MQDYIKFTNPKEFLITATLFTSNRELYLFFFIHRPQKSLIISSHMCPDNSRELVMHS